MKGVYVKFTLAVPGYDDLEAEVTGTLLPGRPAKLYGPPENCYPEEPPEFDLETLEFSDGEPHPELDDDLDLWDAIIEGASEAASNLEFDPTGDE